MKWPTTEDVIRTREEIAMQISSLRGITEMAASYGFDVSKPASNIANVLLARSVKLPTVALTRQSSATDWAMTTRPSSETVRAPEQPSAKRTPAGAAGDRGQSRGRCLAGGLTKRGSSWSAPFGQTGKCDPQRLPADGRLGATTSIPRRCAGYALLVL